MNRRFFLSGLLGAVAGATLDPEQLLWTPTKTIFIPPAPVFYEKHFSVDFDFTEEDFPDPFFPSSLISREDAERWATQVDDYILDAYRYALYNGDTIRVKKPEKYQ